MHLDIAAPLGEKSRLRVLLEHFSRIEDTCELAHPLPEVLLVVCGTIAEMATRRSRDPSRRG
jgi:hypothetical protein